MHISESWFFKSLKCVFSVADRLCKATIVASNCHCWPNGPPLTLPCPHNPRPLFQIDCPSVAGPLASPLSATCWGAVTFWQCCGNMMRTSCLTDLPPLCHALFEVSFCVWKTAYAHSSRRPPHVRGYLFREGSFVIEGPNHLFTWTPAETWGLGLCFNQIAF